ncbi:hypothetical protein B0H13DRAFT_1616654, partial [Mycena leptocephala]
DAEKAIDLFRQSSSYIYGSVSKRLSIARNWSRAADRIGHKSALEAYQTAISLLPQLAMLCQDINSRRKALTLRDNVSLASDAAAWAARLDDSNAAIELLEAGRSVFWSQALQLRTRLDYLYLAYPQLAAKVSDMLKKLEQASHHDLSAHTEAASYKNLSEDWLKALEEVRQLKGFENFLCPKPLVALRASALHGPVVILNTSNDFGCTALIVTFSEDVQRLPLPGISLA